MTIPTQSQQRAMPLSKALVSHLNGLPDNIKTIALIQAIGQVNPEIADTLLLLEQALTETDATDAEMAIDMFAEEIVPILKDQLTPSCGEDDLRDNMIANQLMAAE